MSGPLPKQTVLRLIESGGKMRGRFKARAAQEPRPESPIGEPPLYLDGDQLEVWFRLVEAAPAGLLTGLDRDVFEGFVVLAAARVKLCRQYSGDAGEILTKAPDDEKRYILIAWLREYKRLTESLRVLAHDLGFSPAARTRVAVTAPAKVADPLAEFLGGRAG